nr:MAG TPA: tail protein [Caudoviricetes sp.]
MIDSLILTNVNTSQSVLIDTLDSEFVLGDVDFGTVGGTHHSYKYINQVGVYIDNTTLEQRTISINGWVVGDTYDLLIKNKAVLNQLINPLHKIELTIKDKYKLGFKPDFSIQYSVSYEENNEVLCKFLIQGTCADPMFTTKNRQSTLIASTIPKFKFPLIIPKSVGILMGLREPSLLATLTNRGDIDTGLLITFSCTSTVINPSLLNVNTREFIKINETLSVGEKIVISTESGEKYVKCITSSGESNYFKYMDFDSTWLQLHTGDNVLKYDADDNPSGLEVLVSFSPKYLEVQ